jgi:histidine ammonia-lyase
MGVVHDIVNRVWGQALMLADGMMGSRPCIKGRRYPGQSTLPALLVLFDELNLAASEACSLIVTRMTRLLNPAYSQHLPPFSPAHRALLEAMGESTADARRRTRPVSSDSLETCFQRDVASYPSSAFLNSQALLRILEVNTAGQLLLATKAIPDPAALGQPLFALHAKIAALE